MSGVAGSASGRTNAKRAHASGGRLAAWVSAARPGTLLASVVPVAVGAALAAADSGFDIALTVAALAGAMLIQVGTNLYNDYGDHVRGADTEERVGPARASAEGWLRPNTVRAAATLCFAGAAAAGAVLIAAVGWPILVVGVVSILLGYAYTGGPRPLAYVGLGDIFVLVFFGIVATSGTYFVNTGALTIDSAVAGLVPGFVATAILAVNNVRDAHTDVLANKRTLVVRFGTAFGRAEYAMCLVGAYLAVAATCVLRDDYLPLLALASLPAALVVWRRFQAAEGPALNPVLKQTALLEALVGALFAIGVLL